MEQKGRYKKVRRKEHLSGSFPPGRIPLMPVPMSVQKLPKNDRIHNYPEKFQPFLKPPFLPFEALEFFHPQFHAFQGSKFAAPKDSTCPLPP